MARVSQRDCSRRTRKFAAAGLSAAAAGLLPTGAFVALPSLRRAAISTGHGDSVSLQLHREVALSVATGAANTAAVSVGCGVAAGLALAVASQTGARSTRRSLAGRRASDEGDLQLDECPYTIWGKKDIDVSHVDASFQPMPLEVPVSDVLASSTAFQEEYFKTNRLQILKQLRDHGAVIFRGFELMKEPEGFQRFYEALKMDPCVDPLHSVSARDMVSKKGGIYEAVNKESRQRFFVGMHNEMVGNRTPGAAAFVCFKPAEEGGEFLLLDGRKMVTELDRKFLERLYSRNIRYSTAEFPMGFLDSLALSWAKDMLMPLIESAMRLAVSMKVDFETELIWSTSDYDNSRILQVRAKPQPPVVRHPTTGLPVWFFNVHSHSAWLRDQRQKVYGDEGLETTTGASRINRTDCYYADTGETLTEDDLRHVDEVTMKQLYWVKMQKGDVVLLDNYSVMHGRAPFRGTRKHAVTWFKPPNYAEIA